MSVLKLVNPADASPLGTVPAASEAMMRAAVALAQSAFRSGTWAKALPRERAARMLELARLMERDGELLAQLDSQDAGKPITEARQNDVPSAIESIRWFAEAADKNYGTTSTTGVDVLAYTRRYPYGVTAAILPWNYPLAMAAWKIGPALAVGNSLILKPADATPRSALHVAALAMEAGIPDGVLQVLPGTGPVAGVALASDPDVAAISFTGSTGIGRQVLAAAAESNLKRVSLEMGGKSPQILLQDALEFGPALFAGMVEAAFLTSGQNCTAGSRILIHETVYDEVLEGFTAATDALKVGDPADSATQLGPVINTTAADRILRAVDEAVAAGARAVTGGKELFVRAGGRYIAPTVLTDIPAGHPISRTELFGPVVTVERFSTLEEAIALANDIDYGLSASIWTHRLGDALTLVDSVDAGLVSVGAYSEGDLTVPFGGWKQSGFGGAEKSLRALEQWSREKSVWIQKPVTA